MNVKKSIQRLFVKLQILPPACQIYPFRHEWQPADGWKHFWDYDVNGHPRGMYNKIDSLLELHGSGDYANPKRYQQLLEWKRQGFNVVHTSWRAYRCAHCGKVSASEYYTDPHCMTIDEEKKNEDALRQVVKLVC
jgi:hypothetical protein